MNHPDNKGKPKSGPAGMDILWNDPESTLTKWNTPLIENEKKENVPYITSALIAYLKSMEEILKKEKILQDSLNQKLFYESRIQELQNENQNLKSDLKQIFEKINEQISVE